MFKPAEPTGLPASPPPRRLCVSEDERNQAKRGSQAGALTGGHTEGLSRPFLPLALLHVGATLERPRACGGVSKQLSRAQVRRYRGEAMPRLLLRGGRPGRTRLGLHLARGVGLFPVTVSPKYLIEVCLPCRVAPTRWPLIV